jgi:hypothetical protein
MECPPLAQSRAVSSMISRPALLLDVDGVLNPYGTVTCPEGFTEDGLFPGKNLSACARHTGNGSPSSGTSSTSPGPQPRTSRQVDLAPLAATDLGIGIPAGLRAWGGVRRRISAS